MPKAYLKRFATGPQKRKRYGKLTVYERGKSPREGTPKSESAERGFFLSTTDTGQHDDSFTESWAQLIEDRALDTLICAPSQFFYWTDASRQKMADYWALLFLRSTSFYDFHRNRANEIFNARMTQLNDDADLRRRLVAHYSTVCGRQLEEGELLGSIGRAVAHLLTPSELRNQYVQHLRRRVGIFAGTLLAKSWQIWEAPSDQNSSRATAQ